MNGLVKSISHPFHEHLLFHQDGNETEFYRYCRICHKSIHGPCVGCERCSFWLHRSCAEQPLEIRHQLHPQHELEIYDGSLKIHNLICDECLYTIEDKGLTYFCIECKFFLHQECATSTMKRKGHRSKKISINRLGHNLILYTSRKLTLFIQNSYAASEFSYCEFCRKPISSGKAYACLSCCLHLHEDCALKMPLKIKHPSHPGHTLHLRWGPSDVLSITSCRACNIRFSYSGSSPSHQMNYECSNGFSCWITHSWCTGLLPSLTSERHECSLTYVEKENFYLDWGDSFKDCCGYGSPDKYTDFYRCFGCQRNFHLSCILPDSVKHKYHRHSLVAMNPTLENYVESCACDRCKTKRRTILTRDSLQWDESYCDVCETKRNPIHWAYSCKEECGYCTAHLECALNQERRHPLELESNGILEVLRSLEVRSNSGTMLENAAAEGIQHPSHDHKLSWNDVVNVERSSRYCRCCNKSLSGAAFICTACGYCLHKVCSELPLQLSKLSLHSHQPVILRFTLKGKRFVCDICGEIKHQGQFSYRCQQCKFIMDINCSSLVAPLSKSQGFKKLEAYHFSHSHKLKLGIFKYESKLYCSYCPYQIIGKGYCCLVCDFFLHESCFRQLPRETTVPYPTKHASIIMIDPKSRCTACKLSITGIGYSCLDGGETSFHSICLFSLRQPLAYTFHDHKLYYFGRDTHMKLKTLDDYAWFVCNGCHECCIGAFYRCILCGTNFHLECVPVPQIVKSTCHRHYVKLVDTFVTEGYDLDDQYCDVCEGKRDPAELAYYCDECSDLFISHVDCVLSKMEKIIIKETRKPASIPCSEMKMLEGQPYSLKVERMTWSERWSGVKFVDSHPSKSWILAYSSNYTETCIYIVDYQSQTENFDSIKTFGAVKTVKAKFIAQENWIVVGASDGFISVYDDETIEKIYEFRAHEDEISCLAVHPSQPYLLSSSKGGVIKLWKWSKGWFCANEFLGHSPKRLVDVRFNPNVSDSFVGFAAKDSILMIWNINYSYPIYAFKVHSSPICAMDFFMYGDEQHLLCGFEDGAIKVFNYRTKEFLKQIYGHVSSVGVIHTHPELPIIFTCSRDGTIGIVSATNGYSFEKNLELTESLWGSDVTELVACRKGSDIIFVQRRSTMHTFKLSCTNSEHCRKLST